MQVVTRYPDGIPPFWSSYIKHDDVDAVAAKAAEAGGNITLPPTPAGDIGTFSVIQDPQGAVFNVIKYVGEASPPSGY